MITRTLQHILKHGGLRTFEIEDAVSFVRDQLQQYSELHKYSTLRVNMVYK